MFWETNYESCELKELRTLFKKTKRRFLKEARTNTKNTSTALELHEILNWYRFRLGEPGIVFNNRITLCTH